MQAIIPTSHGVALVHQRFGGVLAAVEGLRQVGRLCLASATGSKGLHKGVARHEAPGLLARPVLPLVLGRRDLQAAGFKST